MYLINKPTCPYSDTRDKWREIAAQALEREGYSFFSCPSQYYLTGIQSQPTGFVIIKCLSFTVLFNHLQTPFTASPTPPLRTLSYN